MKNFSKVFLVVFTLSLLSGFMFGQDTRLKDRQDWLEKDKIDKGILFNGDLCKAEYGVNVKPDPYKQELFVGNWKKVKDNINVGCEKVRLMDLPSEAVPSEMTTVVFWLDDQSEYRKDIYVIRPVEVETYYVKEPYQVQVTKYRSIAKEREKHGELLTVVDEKIPKTIMKPVDGGEEWKILQVKKDKEDVSRKWDWRYMRKGSAR